MYLAEASVYAKVLRQEHARGHPGVTVAPVRLQRGDPGGWGVGEIKKWPRTGS